jgi:hypothetical protein
MDDFGAHLICWRRRQHRPTHSVATGRSGNSPIVGVTFFPLTCSSLTFFRFSPASPSTPTNTSTSYHYRELLCSAHPHPHFHHISVSEQSQKWARTRASRMVSSFFFQRSMVAPPQLHFLLPSRLPRANIMSCRSLRSACDPTTLCELASSRRPLRLSSSSHQQLCRIHR